MLRNRIELEKELNEIITINQDLRVASNAVKNLFIEKGISVAEFNDIWTKRKSLNDIDMPSLYVLTKSLFEITQNKNIKLEDWFTEVEIRDGNNYVREISEEEKIEYPIVIKNVLKGKEDQYMAYIQGSFIKLLFSSGKIPYNFDTQRNPKIKKDESDELIKTANINPESVMEIAKEMDDKTFITNCITLNILQDGTEKFEYNSKRELIIYSGQINPIDGFHRIQAMLVALAENPSLEYITEVRFTHWDVQKCRNFIFQEDKRNKIDKRYMNSIINVSKWGNKVISSLNESNSDIKGKIVTDITYIIKNKALTMFDIMSNTIDELYEIKTNKDMLDLSKWLGTFFDQIIGSYPDEFLSEIGETKLVSVINMPLTFVGYLTLSKVLQNESNWEDKLGEMLDRLDFSITNPQWDKLGIIKNNKAILTYSKPAMTKIINFFEKEVGIINV